MTEDPACIYLAFLSIPTSTVLWKRELDVKSPVACAKFTLNQITKAYWCLTVWAGVQTPQQYPRETHCCSPFMHSYLLIWLTLSPLLKTWSTESQTILYQNALFCLAAIWKPLLLRNKLRDYWSSSCYSWLWLHHETDATSLMARHSCLYQFQVHARYGFHSFKKACRCLDI